MYKTIIKSGLIWIVAISISTCVAAADNVIRLAASTSVENSGLLNYLLQMALV